MVKTPRANLDFSEKEGKNLDASPSEGIQKSPDAKQPSLCQSPIGTNRSAKDFSTLANAGLSIMNSPGANGVTLIGGNIGFSDPTSNNNHAN